MDSSPSAKVMATGRFTGVVMPFTIFENGTESRALLACYSYGSGAVAELFTGTLVAGFQEQLHPHSHQKMLAQRQRLTIAEYEAEFQQQLVTDGSTQELTQSDPTAPHYLTKVEAHQRFYV